MKKIFIGFCLLLMASFSFCQSKTNICTTPVFIMETGISLDSFEVGRTYQNIYNLNSEDTIISIVADCFGSCDFKVINKNRQVILTGRYCGDGVATNQDINIYNENGENIGKKKLIWFEPKKCGVWTYFDANGKKEKEEQH